MEPDEKEIVEKTLDLIMSVVVQVQGNTVHLGDLIERKETLTYSTTEEAETVAESYKRAAREYYEPKIRDNIPEFIELLKRQNKLDH